MQSSQYKVPQHGVLTASLNSLLSMGQVSAGSVGGRSRISASLSPFALATCLCHAALHDYQHGASQYEV